MTEAATKRCSIKNVFLKILQNSQEKTCARVSFLKKLQNTSGRLLLKLIYQIYLLDIRYVRKYLVHVKHTCKTNCSSEKSKNDKISVYHVQKDEATK